jgi:hypothetical protein
MISSRYRYRPVTVPLPFLGLIKHRYFTVTLPLPYRSGPLLTVTDHYSPLLTVTDRYRYSPFFWKFIIFFIAVIKVGGINTFKKISMPIHFSILK